MAVSAAVKAWANNQKQSLTFALAKNSSNRNAQAIIDAITEYADTYDSPDSVLYEIIRRLQGSLERPSK